jgi:hypothetical protein
LIELHALSVGGIVDLFFTVAKNMSQVMRSMWFSTMWSLWKSRNLKLCEEVMNEEVTTIYQRACNIIPQPMALGKF